MSYEYKANTCDIVVIGAGHAGCEAALAAARLGMKTIIFTRCCNCSNPIPFFAENGILTASFKFGNFISKSSKFHSSFKSILFNKIITGFCSINSAICLSSSENPLETSNTNKIRSA